MDDLRLRLDAALADTFQSYTLYGPRSSKKLHALHRFIAEEMQKVFGPGFEAHFLGEGRREFCVPGKYYEKNVDIVMESNGEPVFCVGIKFVTSNYGQNSNNYFENMLGETANIQASNIPYAQMLFLRDPMPYYNKSKEWIKDEKISPHHLAKYIRLLMDKMQAHRPYATCIHLVSIDSDGRIKEGPSDYKLQGHDFADLYDRHFSINAFMEAVRDYRTALSLTS